MSLVICPDCGKEISDAAPTCIGCGRQMIASPPAHPVVVQRSGAKLEMAGFLIILVSMVVGGLGMVSESPCLWLAIGGVGFAAGFIVFIVGRFN